MTREVSTKHTRAPEIPAPVHPEILIHDGTQVDVVGLENIGFCKALVRRKAIQDEWVSTRTRLRVFPTDGQTNLENLVFFCGCLDFVVSLLKGLCLCTISIKAQAMPDNSRSMATRQLEDRSMRSQGR